MSRTIAEIDELITYNAKRRDEMLNNGGIGEMMTAVKFQDRIDGLIEEKKDVLDVE